MVLQEYFLNGCSSSWQTLNSTYKMLYGEKITMVKSVHEGRLILEVNNIEM